MFFFDAKKGALLSLYIRQTCQGHIPRADRTAKPVASLHAFIILWTLPAIWAYPATVIHYSIEANLYMAFCFVRHWHLILEALWPIRVLDTLNHGVFLMYYLRVYGLPNCNTGQCWSSNGRPVITTLQGISLLKKEEERHTVENLTNNISIYTLLFPLLR